MALILPIPDTCEKNERGYCSSSRWKETPLSIYENAFFFSQNRPWKTGSQTGKKQFCFGGETVLEGDSGIPDPPRVVSGIGGFQ
jgi:hypothetical protein